MLLFLMELPLVWSSLLWLLFKATAAPFHMWAPDVYEGSPTIVSTFFAVVPKIAILGLFSRLLMYSFHDLMDSWQVVILVSASYQW